MRKITVNQIIFLLIVSAGFIVPTAAYAQVESSSEVTLNDAISSEQINTDYNFCWWVPGYGCRT